MSSASFVHPSPPSSSMPETREVAMKNRIITHLNADHAFSLQIYLRHFCAVPSKLASTAKITDITTKHMILESGAGRNLIKFEPPMKSLTEARGKSVAMHHEALAGLGLSDIKIETFAMPNKSWQAAIDAAVILCLVTLPFRSQLLPSSGSLISQIWSVGGYIPWLATLAYRVSPLVIPFILVVHTIEAENFARTRLRKHQVPAGSLLWFSWVIHVFIGGIACFNRFDDLVTRIEHEKQKNEKH